MSDCKATTLIIGVGNEYRRDDGAGLAAAARLKTRAGSSCSVIEQSGERAALLEAWEGIERVIIIDAVHSGARPGTLHRWDACSEKIPRSYFHYSTHAFSLFEAIELARTLEELPLALVVYGIEGKRFHLGRGLSPEVEKAVDEIAERVLGELC